METIKDCCMASHPLDSGRRNWLRAGVGAGSAALMAATVSLVPREAEAVILSCIDSRAPAEIILDAGIGDTFNGRIAGNISNRPGEGRKNQDRRLDLRPQ